MSNAVSHPFGDGGRGPGGKFAKGNKGGPGNPHAALASKHRAALLAAIRTEDVKAAVEAIRAILGSKTAKDTDRLAAARELLDRVCGKPVPQDLLERIEALEQAQAERRAS